MRDAVTEPESSRSAEHRSRRLERAFARELEVRPVPGRPGSQAPITEGDIAPLPVSVQRYLRFMGVVGRPRDWSLMARLNGRFKLAPSDSWRSMRALQYDSALDLTRIFVMELRVFGVPVLGRDTYQDAMGRLLVRPLDLFTIEDATGPELDAGELVTYLNDAILLAPSFLLDSSVTFTAVSDTSFDVSLTDGGRTVSARVSLDEQGAPRDFTTTDRYVRDPADPARRYVRTPWSTPISGWRCWSGRMLPKAATALWHLPQGNFSYVEVEFPPDGIEFNVLPSLR